MKPEHKKYILENINRQPIYRIAQELDIKERKINKFLQKHKQKNKQTDDIPQPKSPLKKSTVWVSVVLIIILGLAVYGNSLPGKFVWDDNNLVKNNSYITGWSNTAKIFTTDITAGGGRESCFYRPLQILTYMVDYSFWKLDPKGYHLNNILLHIFAALAILWLVTILYNNWFLSLTTSILFVVYPIHTEAVTYISGRADPLALLFMLLCFIFYIKRASSKSRLLYILMLSSYILALLSRESSLILPVLLLLYHYTFRQGIKAIDFFPISAIALIYILLRLTFLRYLLPHTYISTTLIERIPGFFVAITSYTILLFLPFNLHMEYGNQLFHFTDFRAIIGVAILSSLLFYAFRQRRTRQLAFFSICWLFITLLPASNLYPINAYMAEHWLYLPSIGFFLLLTNGLNHIYRKKEFRTFTIILFMGLVIFYSCLTVRQNTYWREPIAFYERTLRYASHSSRMYNVVGFAYYTIKKNEKAVSLYKKAIEIDPSYAKAYNNLGVAYYAINKHEEAIAAYRKAIENEPENARAHNNLGVAYYATSRNEEAISSYKKAIEINPNFAEAYNNLGRAYYAINKNKEAIAAYNRAIEINPNYAAPYNNLSIFYFDNKQYKLAIEYCDRAKELGFSNPTISESIKPYR